MPTVRPSSEQDERRAGLDGDELGRAHRQVGALEQAGHLLEVGRAAERALTAQHEQVAQRQPAARAPRRGGCDRPAV